MVVVVQLFAANQDAPGQDVGGRITALEVAVAQGMAQPVDDACSEYRDPHHLYRPDGDAEHTEQRQVDDGHQCDAGNREAAVKVALDPVIGAVLAVDAQGLLVLGLFHVELCAFAQHSA